MASSGDLDRFITLVLSDPSGIDEVAAATEILISTADIDSWDLSKILGCQTVKVQAQRSRLVQESSYFHGLLSGSFSESCLERISIRWNLEASLSVLKCIYGCPLGITSENFLPLLDAALYFGVEMLLLKCKTWFSDATPSKGPDHRPEIGLDDLVHIWNFGVEHGSDFVAELCVDYLARNFMWAVPSKLFGDVPYKLLLLSIKHPHLTVDSEMHLCDALLAWLNANTKWLECSNNARDDIIVLIKQVRTSLLPMWFAAGKRRSCHISKLADESIDSIFRLMKVSSTSSTNMLLDSHLDHLRIRLTEYSERLDLSGCPQMTASILVLSVLPSSASTVPMWRKHMKDFLTNLERGEKDQIKISQGLLPVLSFEAVQEIDISLCSGLNLKAAIECFSRSFPSLRKLKAAYLLNFKAAALHKLVTKCPQICEVDLTVDTTPVIPGQVSVVSSSAAIAQPPPNRSLAAFNSTRPLYCSPSNITRLTLEGRSDIRDSDLQSISRLCDSLHYLNIRGCTAVTDVCISDIISRCKRLHSIVVCDTLFGRNSVLSLCSDISSGDVSRSSFSGEKPINPLASNLQTLHMGGCKRVDESSFLDVIARAWKLKSLCLRDTDVADGALCNFSGSSLEMLDVSNTMISRAALAHIVKGNPGLKCLKARGCKNLLQQESNPSGTDCSPSYFGDELVNGVAKRCTLEELQMGWGFSYFSLQSLRPAIAMLRAISVGLGGSLGEDALKLLPLICPLLESIVLHFQVISDPALTNVTMSLKHLQELALCYCFGDISISSFKIPMQNLRKLRLERVTRWMTNDDLFVLTQSCPNLIELSLAGCQHLNKDSQQIISYGWPGLISLHLEDCGGVTANGVSSLFYSVALEDLVLRHNGQGIQRNFVLTAASQLPMLRLISLDLCDAIEGDFDIPDFEDRCFLSTVKIARCKSLRCALDLSFREVHKSPVHKETLVLAWSSTNLVRTVVKERL